MSFFLNFPNILFTDLISELKFVFLTIFLIKNDKNWKNSFYNFSKWLKFILCMLSLTQFSQIDEGGRGSNYRPKKSEFFVPNRGRRVGGQHLNFALFLRRPWVELKKYWLQINFPWIDDRTWSINHIHIRGMLYNNYCDIPHDCGLYQWCNGLNIFKWMNE